MATTSPLETIFDADRALRDAEAALLANPADSLPALLSDAVDEALALDDRKEGGMRLERLADLCAQVPGPAMADALLRILDDDDPAVRVAAGEALRDVGFERYVEVAHAVERALEAGGSGPALAEVPWILVEIGEPSALRLIRTLLGHEDPHVIASSIESLAELGESEAIEALAAFVDDDREVTLEDLEEETVATIGELALAAIEALGGGDDEEAEA